jgi:predicted transglutaminase-like cysteine proteinase
MNYFRNSIVDTCWAILIVFAISCGLAEVSHAYTSDRIRVAAITKGSRAVTMANEMNTMLEKLQNADDRTMRESVNDFYNSHVVYLDDPTLYSSPDYWASPLETFVRGKGDCEDYAIAKYFTLLQAGMPSDKLRLVYVKANLGNATVGHMVLAYYASLNEEPVILDNLINDIKSASNRPDLKPVYSFNSAGLWQGTGNSSAGDPMIRISKWRDTVEKSYAEGFEK